MAVLKPALMNTGLRRKLAVALTVVSLIPLFALGYFSYYQSANTIQDLVSKYTNDITNEININIFLNFKDIDDIGKVLLNSEPVKEILSRENREANREDDQDRQRMIEILKSIKFSNDYITSIYILSEKSGNIYAVGDVTGNYGINFFTEEYRKNYKKTALYRDTVTEYNNYKWWPTRNILGQNVFILTRKLYDVDRGVLGVLVIHISQNILENINNRLYSGKGSQLYLLDERGRYLFHPDSQLLGRKMADQTILREIKRHDNGSFTVAGAHKKFVVFNTFFVTGWKLVILTPFQKLIAEATLIRNVTVLIIVICFILVSVLSVLIAKGIVNPVQKLNLLMQKGATGDMDVRFNVRYQDEIGELGHSFNLMMGNIKQLMQLLETKEQQKIEAEIRALEAHINPHFLYNTLASIYWMAMAEGNQKVGEMASALSNFFRLGLNRGKEFTSVANEVDHVRNYLNIQKLRFHDQFNYEIDLENGLGAYQTIKLILQPLVENSLIHGFEGLTYQGRLRISVTKQRGRIVFQAADNGKGIPELSERGLQAVIDTGYGLKNIQERLRLYFANDFSIHCTSIPGQETVFAISIPAVMEEN